MTLRKAILCCAVLAGLLPGPAAAAQNAAVTDCTSHNALTGHYSVVQLQDALATMPVDVKEYTACYDLISRQLQSELGRGGNGTGGGGGSLLPTPLLILLIALLLGGAAYSGLALRRRSAAADGGTAGAGGEEGPDEPPGPPAPPL